MKKKRFQHSICLTSPTAVELCFSSVENMPEAKGSVAFITDSAKVFKDDIDITPITLTDGTQYMPWGGDNMMPYNILSMIEKDETLATCQMFNAEVCYGSGLVYNTDGCASSVKEEVEDFLLTNSLPSYFLGVCQDFKHFGWCVSVIILDNVPAVCKYQSVLLISAQNSNTLSAFSSSRQVVAKQNVVFRNFP